MLRNRWITYNKLTGKIRGVIEGLPPEESEYTGVMQHDYADNFGTYEVDVLTNTINTIMYSTPAVSPVTLRISAYINESDPLYMEWQYDKTPSSEQIWRDKVLEIKNRYPVI